TRPTKLKEAAEDHRHRHRIHREAACCHAHRHLLSSPIHAAACAGRRRVRASLTSSTLTNASATAWTVAWCVLGPSALQALFLIGPRTAKASRISARKAEEGAVIPRRTSWVTLSSVPNVHEGLAPVRMDANVFSRRILPSTPLANG